MNTNNRYCHEIDTNLVKTKNKIVAPNIYLISSNTRDYDQSAKTFCSTVFQFRQHINFVHIGSLPSPSPSRLQHLTTISPRDGDRSESDEGAARTNWRVSEGQKLIHSRGLVDRCQPMRIWYLYVVYGLRPAPKR